MAYGGSPITHGRMLFGGGTMLCCAEFVRIEEGMLAVTIGAHGAPRDSHRNHHRHRENDEQHADGEPATGYLRTFHDDSVEQVVQPIAEAVAPRSLGVDGFCELALRRLMGGLAVDVYCGHVTAAG